MPYRRLDMKIWIDDKIVDKQPFTKLAWIYTLTGLHTTSLPGLWIAGTESMAEGLRVEAQLLEEELRLLESVGLIQRDPITKLLRVPKCPKYNQAENERVVHAWFGHWEQLPDSQMRRDHIASLWLLGIKRRRPTDKHGSLIRGAWNETFGRYVTQVQGEEGKGAVYAFIEPERIKPEQLSLRLSVSPQNRGLITPSGDLSQGVRESFANSAPDPVPAPDPDPDPDQSSRTGENHFQEREALAEAYVQGIREATGGPFPRPVGEQAAALLTAAGTYALDQSGSELVGSARIAWVRSSVTEYRRAMGGEGARYQRGFQPTSWLLWLQAGRPSDSTRNGPRSIQRGGYTEEDARAGEERFAEAAAQREAELRAQYAAEGVPDPWEDP